MSDKRVVEGSRTKFEEKFHIKDESSTDEGYGVYPNNRGIVDYIRKGIVCVDKPFGPTSHEVTVWVRKILEVGKTGHAGTLDPNVTGALPVLIENSVKLLKTLQSSQKEYVAIMRLHDDVNEQELLHVMNMFVGKIYQRPPLESAVKRRLRVRRVYNLDFLEREGRDVLFRVRTEAGTYIRNICRDIGEILGSGAHMQELRRTKTGIFDESMCFTLQELQDAYVFWKEDGEEKYLRQIIQPMEKAVSNMPKILVKDSAVDALCHGANLNTPGINYIEKGIKAGDKVAIFTLKNELVAIGESKVSDEDMLKMKSGTAVDLSRVIMERGVYPPMWK
ncbi:MAG: RNA-guided pseudouridylation complex pseudouridine synthase subunit Cbf5 [Archaeoglobaceae archaeon]